MFLLKTAAPMATDGCAGIVTPHRWLSVGALPSSLVTGRVGE